MKNSGIALLAALLFVPVLASAHCEVPCGIYDDEARVAMLAEDATTIAKAMEQIEALSSADEINYNQLVRWINAKEEHATKIQQMVSQYFMTQRIKPDQDNYAEKLQSLHRMLVSAMKCKQTTDLANVEALRGELEVFHGLYFGEH
jgi:nickel superoxide dismutase